MSKLQCWWIVMSSILFGISDRTLNSIIKNYSIDSVAQVIPGLILLLLVYYLYPYHLE